MECRITLAGVVMGLAGCGGSVSGNTCRRDRQGLRLYRADLSAMHLGGKTVTFICGHD